MSDDRLAVLLEDIQDKLIIVAEAAALSSARFDALEAKSDRILEIVEDMFPLKAEVIDQSDKLTDHETRLQKFEMPQRA